MDNALSTGATRLWRRLPPTFVRVRRGQEGEEQRATFLELFFDLVFVFAITQLSGVLVADLTLAGVGKTLFLLMVVWWAWMYTTWMTNWFDPETLPVRAVLLIGMIASMLGAIAIPEAFGDLGLLFVVGYVSLQFFRNAFMVIATEPSDPLYAPFLRMFAWNTWVGAIWLAGAFLEGEGRVAVWLLALVLDYAGPFFGHWTPRVGRSRPTEWELEHSHFIDRIQTFMIIALGESILVTGLTASSLELTPLRLLAIVVAMLNTAAFWWLYFHYHARVSKERLADERGQLARDLSYLHVPMILGVIVAAVCDELVIADPGEPLGSRGLVALAAGPMLYLLGSVLFKLRLYRTLSIARVVASGLVACVAVAGTAMPALATWSLVFVILVGLAVFESRDPRSLMVRPPLRRE